MHVTDTDQVGFYHQLQVFLIAIVRLSGCANSFLPIPSKATHKKAARADWVRAAIQLHLFYFTIYSKICLIRLLEHPLRTYNG